MSSHSRFKVAGSSVFHVTLFAAALTVFGLTAAVKAADATVPGEPSSPYPTIINLAVEWPITGDDNLNGVVTVEYRMAGEESWRQGMPLRRIPADIGRTTQVPFSWVNKHSGSIFDLKPDTEYEIRLRLSDPDGGSAEKTIRARTRAVPKAASDAVVKKVNAANFRDAEAAADPGDILLLAPGYYENFVATRDGEPGKPIVIRSDRSHYAINSTFDQVSLRDRKHVILEGVTVYGSVDLLGAEDVAVRGCTVNAKYGIIASRRPGAKNCYISDNVVTYVMPWVSEGTGASMVYGGSGCVGEGIQLTGPGNVVCYNRVKGYRDCISTMEDRGVFDQRCIDIYNNDIYVGADDGVECDFSQGNCRVMRNRLTNCFMGLSSQPGLGGPTYFIRNVIYNLINCPFKLSRNSKGDVVLHNTVVKSGDGFMVVHNPSLALFRNNLLIGGKAGSKIGLYGSGTGLAVYFPNANSTCDMDYDGVGTFSTPFKGQIGRVRFESLEELRNLTTEKHAVQVDLEVFKDKVAFPYPPMQERLPADLSLRPGSVAVDAGIVIPNVNDGFTGKAPDLGAYELDGEIPFYGPRYPGVDEETMWQEKNAKK